MSDNRCENCQKTFDKCRDDMAFVQAYYQGLEGMKTLLTRERDEAHARVAELEKELSVTNDIYTDEHEERGMYQSRCADLEAHAATLTGLANQYKAERNSLEETCRMHSARVIELEKQRDDLLSRKDHNALAFTRSVQYIENLLKYAPKENTEGHEFMAQFVKTLRDMAQSITDTTKPTKPARAEGDHVHELGSCTHCDTRPIIAALEKEFAEGRSTEI